MKRFQLLLGLVALSALACQPKDKPKDEPKTESAQSAQTGVPADDSTDIPVGLSATKGPADALVTIVEFSEFQCPFCSRVTPTIKSLQEKYGDKIRVVFKHSPLAFHKDAPYASQAALAAGRQGKFWEMHDKLFENQRELSKDAIAGYAKAIGLDMAKFEKDVEDPAVKKQIEDDQALAAKVGARGTPNFLINGKSLVGAQPLEEFTKVIDEELAAAEALVKSGTKASLVYSTRVKANFKAPEAAPAAADPSKTVYKMPLNPANPGIKGGKEPLVTIVEFSEFQCPFCSRVGPTLKQLEADYGDKIQIQFRHNPLPFHQDAPLASEAALAAGAQGKFWEMHDKLFANQTALKRENLDAYAQELGLDMAKFKADLDGGVHKATVEADKALAAQFGARGTPNFFVNGRQLIGAKPIDAFKAVIDEEIKKAEDLIAKGTPRADVYTKLTENGLLKAAAPTPRPQENDTTVYKVPVEANEYAKGPKDALVTVVIFSEFQCPFCKRVSPTLEELSKKYGPDLRLVFKHNPLPFHNNAQLASEAALAAGAQGKFWEMHDLLFADQQKLTRADLEAHAATLKLDLAKFKADLDSGAHKPRIEADKALAAKIGARGTPNMFINGRKIVGAQPLENFTKLVDEELAKAKKLVDAGTARAQVYETIMKSAVEKAAEAPRPAAEDDKTIYEVPVLPVDAVKGNPKAVITIVEFSEFQCPFCSRVVPTMDELAKTYGDKVRIVFKHNPLSFHQDAPLAAEAALAAGAQGKFWQMHDALFANQRALKREDLEKYAQELGLNMAKFKADLDSGKFKEQIKADQELARKVGASGTPTFFINGRKLRGAQPADAFKAVIDEELKKLGK